MQKKLTLEAIIRRTKQMIGWNDNAKAAVREFAEYVGRSDFCERYLASVDTKKTVADAVEWHKKSFGSLKWNRDSCDVIAREQGWMFLTQESALVDSDGNAEIVCTRAEFEAYVKEQEGEKWTHEIRATKEYCYISEGPNDSGQVFIKTNKGTWDCLYVEQLKPINPTISSKQVATIIEAAAAWGIAPDECQDYLSKFTVEEDEGECHF